MLRSTPEFVAAHLDAVRGPAGQRRMLRAEAIERHREAKRQRRALRLRTILRAIPFARRKTEIAPVRPASESP